MAVKVRLRKCFELKYSKFMIFVFFEIFEFRSVKP
jgi:hypothetical protein